MKVLVVTNDFPPRVGGINYYVDQIFRRLPDAEVTVFASNWPGARAFDATFPHEVVRWPARSLVPTPSALRRVVSLARSERSDVVVFGASMPLALMGPEILARTGVPYAGCTHGVEMIAARLPGVRAALGRFGRRALFLTTVSDWCRRVLRPWVGEETPIELLPPGIDAERFRPDTSDGEIRARHGLGDAPVIVCVSRLVPRKGQDQVIRALPRIAREHPDVRFLCVGGGPYEPKLREMARERGVAGRVVFAGEVPYEELAQHFRAGDVFAMPCRSRWLGLEVEALGAVFLQANAVGRPVVAGDSGGAPEAVREGETGLVVDGTDHRAVGDAISTLLADPPLAEKMGRAGAEWVRRDLTWEAVAVRLRTMLEDALGGGG